MNIVLLLVAFVLAVAVVVQHLAIKRKTKLFKVHLYHVALPYFKSQMNPHFIKNLLQTVNYFILFDSKENASRCLKKFSVLVDKTLKLADVELITLADEIEVLELYLELQHYRFANKFDFVPIVADSMACRSTIRLADDVNPNEVKIPPMVIQPFVENAIVHGLEPKSEKGTIEIDFSIEYNLLVCRISDSGIGRKASQEMEQCGTSMHAGNGIGLKNVFQRLSLIEETLSIKIHLDVANLDDGCSDTGTVVTLKLPAEMPRSTSTSSNFDSMIQLESRYMTKFMR